MCGCVWGGGGRLIGGEAVDMDGAVDRGWTVGSEFIRTYTWD